MSDRTHRKGDGPIDGERPGRPCGSSPQGASIDIKPPRMIQRRTRTKDAFSVLDEQSPQMAAMPWLSPGTLLRYGSESDARLGLKAVPDLSAPSGLFDALSLRPGPGAAGPGLIAAVCHSKILVSNFT